jgi:site-specific recombinase XerD
MTRRASVFSTDKQVSRKMVIAERRVCLRMSSFGKFSTRLLSTSASDSKEVPPTGKRPGAKYAAIKRLDSLMAIGVKRSLAKRDAGARGESLFAFSDGLIHSYEARENYQKVVMRFLNWCRDHYELRDLDTIDEQADELASLFLAERIAQGYSAWTLQTERSALRTFFQDRHLTDMVELPQRKRENIKRSRRPAKRDQHINLENWQHVIQFCLATGLRREELRDLYVRDVYVRKSDQQLVVCVVKGKGGKQRQVPVFPGREQAVQSQMANKAADAHVFERVTGLLDIHSYRRQFAQELYEHLSGRPLPKAVGRLESADLDKDVALYVSRCLGHNRIDIIFQHYIR